MDALSRAQRYIVESQALLSWVGWAPFATGFSGEAASIATAIHQCSTSH
jgi:hypothetical protein